MPRQDTWRMTHAGYHWRGIPASLTTFSQRSSSERTNATNSSRLVGAGSMTSSVRRCRTSAACSVLVDGRRDPVRRDIAMEQGIAVSGRLGDEGRGNGTARAGAVLDDDRLPERAAHALGEQTPDDVGRAARRKRHNDRDRLRRIGLRMGSAQRSR
jgi:hypothetical protein